MNEFKRVSVLLRDSEDSQEHNEQIIQYLNERHEYINDMRYHIAVDIVDDTNINKYIKQGITSIPALIPPEGDTTDAVYGVNAILASLSKLEVIHSGARKVDSFASQLDSDPDDAYRARAIKEMLSGEEDDHERASSVRMRGQDVADTPLNERDVEAKMSKYQAIYDARKKLPGNGKKPIQSFAKSKPPSAKQSIEKLIAEKGYDKGEAALMREVVRNLD